MNQIVRTKETTAPLSHGVSRGEAFRVWLRVAALSFGGPAGQIAVMHRIIVEELHGALSAITAAVVGVVLNLAIWFAVHTLFRETQPIRGFGFSFDAPVFATVNVPALLLAVAAIVAMFRFKVGMIPTLAACSAAGIVLYLAGAI